MAYTPTVWQTGDIVTSEKLNHAENGIAAANDKLPTPTSADYGKSPIVGKIAVAGAVVVAEQTVTTVAGEIGSSATLTGVPSFVDQQKYLVTVNGVDYVGTYYMGVESIVVSDEYGDTYIEISDVGSTFFILEEPGTYTVKVSEALYEYDYALDKYPQYDIVITCTALSSDAENYTLVKFDPDALVNKVRSGELVDGILFHHYNYDISIEGDTNAVLYRLDNINVDDTFTRAVFWGYCGGSKNKVTVVIATYDRVIDEVTAATWS